MRLVMNGALGRMGRRILTLANSDPDFTISGAVDIDTTKKGNDIGELIGVGAVGSALTDNLSDAIESADVVIDFTWPDVVLKTAELCGKTKTPLVVGTTGLDSAALDVFKRHVSGIPCVLAPNMSVGVNVLFKLAAETAAILGESYDIEIMEVHHRFKKDAPSGTAKRLAEVIAEARKKVLDDIAVYGRQGITGERTAQEIGIHALRAGDVVGEHTVTFGTIGERIELVHRLHSRDALAQGALRAAKFIISAKPGLYDMQDVLGLKD